MFIDAVFYLVSILLISNSLLILFSKNVYRSAVFLAFSMLCFAAMYFMLSAEFIGVIQILVYVGAVSVLIALSVMLVKDIEKSTDNNKLLYYSSIIGLIFLVLISFFIINFNWDEFSNNILDNSNCLLSSCGSEPGILIESTNWLGKLITTDFMIAFQLSGLILLASLIGALALHRVRMNDDSE